MLNPASLRPTEHRRVNYANNTLSKKYGVFMRNERWVLLAKYTWQVNGNVHSHTVVVCGSLRPLWATLWPGELEGGSLAID